VAMKLNAGCGNDIRPGWINLDKTKLANVDIVHDLEDLPLPFGNESFDEILCQDVLEHLEYVPLMKDLHRILKKGGKLHVRVPHFSSPNSFADPTHKKVFSIKTFDFFVKNNNTGRNYYFDFSFDHIESPTIILLRGPQFIYKYATVIGPFINRNRGAQLFYENSFMCRLFPAENVELDLIK
jgi:SAM-dependent methyltransferase